MIPVGYKSGTKTFSVKTAPASGGTPISLSAASGSRISATFFNNGAASLALGLDATITSSTGYLVPAGASFTDSVSSDAWFGVSTTASTLDIRVIEVFVS